MAKRERVKFEVDRSWSARQIADEARAFTKNLYREHPEVLWFHECFLKYGASETEFWPLLTPEERSALHDFPLVVTPTGAFDVWIAVAPSGDDKFIVFDLCILLELVEFFSAIPNQSYPVWAACILQGALRQTTGPRLNVASWVEAPAREMKELMARKAPQAPYSSSVLFGLPFCMNFLLAHEYGHHALKHFGDESLICNGETAGMTAHLRKTSHDMEFAADCWSLNVISRLPAFDFSSWLLSIEMMFWYMNLVESFNKNRRTIEGITTLPDAHPPVIVRAERISRLGEKVLEAELDEAGRLPEPLFNNLQDRQRIWSWVKKLDTYTQYLAECYCGDPDKTVAIHEAVRAGEQDMDTYEAEMKAIARKHRFDSPFGIAKRAFRHIKSKLF